MKRTLQLGLLSVAVVGLVFGVVAWAQMGGPMGGPGAGAAAGACPMGGGGMGGFYPGFVAQSPEEATQAVQAYLGAFWRNPDLIVGEVMPFSNHFYVQVFEESTGIGAMELLVDRLTGEVFPEPGPNMMWNAKYGPMGGFGHMGGPGGGSQATTQMTVLPEQARQFAQAFLDAYLSGTIAAAVTPFYGYYTLHVERDGQIVGMLSVHGATGQVWFHNWHGTFLGNA